MGETKKTILIVEDEIILSMLEKTTLEREGFAVLTASTGEKALGLFGRPHAIDLILMDIDLGSSMDGTEVAEKILETDDIPILFLTSHNEPEIIEKTEKITSYGFVTKSSNHAILLTSIKMAFRLFEARQKEKKNERALRASETRFRTLLHDLPALAIQGYGMDGITQYWNPASERMYGYTAEEAIGKSLLDLIIPDEMKEGVAGAIRRMADYGELIPPGELVLRQKNGQPVHVYSNHTMVRTPEHGLELFCLDTDISERKLIESRLRASEKKFSDIFHHSSHPIMIVDTETGAFAEVNEAMIRNLEYSEDELVGHSAVELGIITAESEARSRQLIHDQGSYSGIEVAVTTKSGARRTGLLHAHLNEFEGRTYLVQTIVDITDHFRLSDRFPSGR